MQAEQDFIQEPRIVILKIYELQNTHNNSFNNHEFQLNVGSNQNYFRI